MIHSNLLNNDDSTRASPAPIPTELSASLGDLTTTDVHIPPLSPPMVPISTRPTRAPHTPSYLRDYIISIILLSRSPLLSNSVVVPSTGYSFCRDRTLFFFTGY